MKQRAILWGCIVMGWWMNVGNSVAQNGRGYRTPMDHQVSLAGNFGELRRNHFHSGLDYRTESVQGKLVHAVKDGWVSRIGISPWGYGNVLYVYHPETQETSVYAHLRNFNSKIDSAARAHQYALEQWTIDVTLEEGEIPVKEGDVIAYSGNTGSSGGPHLHFELRDSTGRFINPAQYTMGVSDGKRPKVYQLRVIPQKGEGLVNGTETPRVYGMSLQNGVVKPAQPVSIEAWGKVGVALKTLDFADFSNNTLGVYRIEMRVDSALVFDYTMRGFTFFETRYMNSLIDYDYFVRNKAYFMKLYADPGNKLPVYDSLVNRGIIDIDEERVYHVECRVSDIFGNATKVQFNLKGKRAESAPCKPCAEMMRHDLRSVYRNEDFQVKMSDSVLYNDLCLNYKREIGGVTDGSDKHTIGNDQTPIHTWYEVGIRAKNVRDTARVVALRTGQYCGRSVYTGEMGTDSIFRFKARDLGTFVLKEDSIAPTITPVHTTGLTSAPYISVSIADGLAGIGGYKGYVDGKWVPFARSAGNVLRCDLRDLNLRRKTNHEVKIVVWDAVGNRKEWTKTVYY